MTRFQPVASDRFFDAYVKHSVPGLRRLARPLLLPVGHAHAAGCAVIVELREHSWMEHCLRNVAHFLPKSWSMLIVHGNENQEYIQQILTSWGMSDVIGLHNLGVGNVTRDEYSNLLKTAAFWELIPTRRTLIFQTDSMLLRHGLEDFHEWDYIGAPWNDFHVPEGVGNGGLSLRTVSVMKEIADRYGSSSPDSEMEDVFYARMLHLHGEGPEFTGRLATRKAAHSFCVEWRLRDMPAADSPLAIHQAWQSHAPEQIMKWFRLADSGYVQK